jgi:hypothetical protein
VASCRKIQLADGKTGSADRAAPPMEMPRPLVGDGAYSIYMIVCRGVRAYAGAGAR